MGHPAAGDHLADGPVYQQLNSHLPVLSTDQSASQTDQGTYLAHQNHDRRIPARYELGSHIAVWHSLW